MWHVMIYNLTIDVYGSKEAAMEAAKEMNARTTWGRALVWYLPVVESRR